MPISNQTEKDTTAIELDDLQDVNVGTPGPADDGKAVTWVDASSEFQLVTGGGGSALTVEDEGSPLSTAVTKINFVGAGVTATEPVSDEIDVTIPGGGGSALTVEDEGSPLSAAVTKINFVGAGVTATEPVANEIDVTIPGGGGGGGGDLEGVRVEQTAAQAITFASLTFLDWDDEIFDDNGYHDNVTNNSRITIPETGRYFFSTNVQLSQPAQNLNEFVAVVVLNGDTSSTPQPWLASQRLTQWSSTFNPAINLAGYKDFTAGDYLEVAIFYNAVGGDQSLTTLDNRGTYFSVTKAESAGGSALTVEDEGSPLSTAVTKINFVGAGVTATQPVADEIDVTIPGGGGGPASVADPTGAEIRLDNDQTISDNTWTVLSWDSEILDQEDYIDIGGQPTRFTIPETNWYFISPQIKWDVSSAGERSVWIRLNGSSSDSDVHLSRHNPVASVNSYSSASEIAYLTSGDYLETWVNQNTGGNLDVIGENTTAGEGSRCRIVKVGESAVTTGAEVNLSSNQSIPDSAWTVISWDVEVLDQDNYVDIGGNPTRFTVPDTGWYQLSSFVHWDNNATGYRASWIRVNGSAIDVDGLIHRETALGTAVSHYQTVSRTTYLTSGDYVELYVAQDSGGNLNVLATSSFETRMRIVKIKEDTGSPTLVTGGIKDRQSSSQSIPNNSATALSSDTEVIDENDYIDIGGNPTRITIPAAGWYIISGFTNWESDGTGIRESHITINGSTADLDGHYLIQDATSGVADFVNASTPLFLAQNDYVELLVRQTSGGNLDIEGNTAGSRLSAVRLLGEVTAGSGGGNTDDSLTVFENCRDLTLDTNLTQSGGGTLGLDLGGLSNTDSAGSGGIVRLSGPQLALSDRPYSVYCEWRKGTSAVGTDSFFVDLYNVTQANDIFYVYNDSSGTSFVYQDGSDTQIEATGMTIATGQVVAIEMSFDPSENTSYLRTFSTTGNDSFTATTFPNLAAFFTNGDTVEYRVSIGPTHVIYKFVVYEGVRPVGVG